MQLNNKIFGNTWLLALLVCLIYAAVVGSSGVIVPAIGAIILAGPMSYGIHYVFLKQARDGEDMQIGDLFKGFSDDFGGTLLLSLLMGIFVALWSLLLVVPGIIMAYAYSMAFNIKIDNPEFGWHECLQESKRIMKGNKWRLFCLDLSFIGWGFVCLFTCGLGYFWLIPYMNAARTQFYLDIKPNYQTYTYTE